MPRRRPLSSGCPFLRLLDRSWCAGIAGRAHADKCQSLVEMKAEPGGTLEELRKQRIATECLGMPASVADEVRLSGFTFRHHAVEHARAKLCRLCDARLVQLGEDPIHRSEVHVPGRSLRPLVHGLGIQKAPAVVVQGSQHCAPSQREPESRSTQALERRRPWLPGELVRVARSGCLNWHRGIGLKPWPPK